MRISARNVLPGTVAEIKKGAVNAEVVMTLRGREVVISVITNASVESLGLETGTEAFAIIKASDVMVGKDLENAKIGARNILTVDCACALWKSSVEACLPTSASRK